MLYKELVNIYIELEKTSKRIEKTSIISEFLKSTPSADLPMVVLLLQGRLFPAWDEREIGVASRIVLKAINVATGVSVNDIEKRWKKAGDLGIVAEEIVKVKKQKTLFNEELTVSKVLENLRKLAELEGKGTVEKKINLISELLLTAKPVEARYIIKTVLNELRVGVAGGVLRDSIAKAFGIDVQDIEKAYELSNDYCEVIERAKKGVKNVRAIGIKLGKPIRVMLPIRVNTIEEAFKALGEPVQCEDKLDGFRVQVHKKGNNLLLFTRRLENVTNQFKEVLPVLRKHVKGDSYILDTELVGFNPKTKKYLPFQNISQRIKRKYDIEKMAKSLPVEINVFDIVSYNGESLFNKPLKERREILEKIVKEEKRTIVLTRKLVTDDKMAVDRFYKEALKDGYEGVIFKKLDSGYKPGRYVGGWIKLKPVMETLDLAIVGADWGQGKRARTMSSFTIACRDDHHFLEIGKVGTGIKENEEEGVSFKLLTKLLSPLIVEEKGTSIKLKPRIVIEIKYEEIQKSPTYSSGFALRFPRFVRIREDKGPNECSTLNMVNELYKGQRK